MSGLLWNIMLALVWSAMSGEFTSENFIIGFALGFLILYFARSAVGTPGYGRKVRQVIGLFFFFLWELVKANVRVAYDVLTPGFHIRPGLIAIPLDVRTDLEITLLANLITLTPGTLSLDVSSDRRTLYIHAMYVDDPEQVRQEIKQGFERRLLAVMR